MKDYLFGLIKEILFYIIKLKQIRFLVFNMIRMREKKLIKNKDKIKISHQMISLIH
jgi:hypothetical protein